MKLFPRSFWLITLLLMSACLLLASCDRSDPPTPGTDEVTTTAEEVTETPTESPTEEVTTEEVTTEEITEPEDTTPTDEMLLSEILSNKTQLRFDENGQFKIMVLADLHLNSGGVPMETFNNITLVVEREKPDFVIFTGDNVVDGGISTQGQLRGAWRRIGDYLEQEGIYWMHVFGNHDGDMRLPLEKQQEYYESFEHCLSKAGDEELTGIGNYVIPLYGAKEDTVKFVIWGLDSGDYPTEEERKALFPAGLSSFGGFNGTNYDFIHYDQIQWYLETSKLLQTCNDGQLVPGLMAFHIPLQESYTAWINRDGLEWTGSKYDPVCASAYNSGLFEVLRNRGDIKAVVNGHDHINDFMVNYCGIKLCYASTLTTTTYNEPAIMGARIFVISESEPTNVQTYMSYLDESMMGGDDDEGGGTVNALSGCIENFEGTAPQFTVSSYNGATEDAAIENILAEVVEGQGVNGSSALAFTRTVFGGDKLQDNTEIIWDIVTPGALGENKYLVVWMDLATNDVEFRKASFGLLADNMNRNPFRTDDHDSPSVFYYKAEGSDEWTTLQTGGDGCFGEGDDCPVRGYKGWFAFPVEYMPRVGSGATMSPQTNITGVYFYMCLSEAGMAGKPVYMDEIQLVEDYTAIG